MGELKASIDTWNRITQSSEDLTVLLEMSTEEPDLLEEIEVELSGIKATLDELELRSALDGPHDASNALRVVHSGEGGVDAQDWAQLDDLYGPAGEFDDAWQRSRGNPFLLRRARRRQLPIQRQRLIAWHLASGHHDRNVRGVDVDVAPRGFAQPRRGVTLNTTADAHPTARAPSGSVPPRHP